MRAALPDVGVRHLSRWIFNCYLIENGGSDTPFVVDPGLPSIGKAVLNELRHGLDRDVGDLACIAATHLHSDHVGAVGQLHRASAATVVMPGKARDYTAGEKARLIGLAEFWAFRPFVGQQPFEWGALWEAIRGAGQGIGKSGLNLDAPIDAFAQDGEPLPGAPDWEVIATPGHTDCSACYWNPTTRTLISGDTILTHDGRAWFNPERIDPKLMDATENRLRALPVEHLLPGHGRPISGPNLMGRALSHRDKHPGR